MLRQGDFLFIPVDGMPPGLKAVSHDGDVIIGSGETGHMHMVKKEFAATEYSGGGIRYLGIPEGGADVTHDEHGTLSLSQGVYEIRKQRQLAANDEDVQVID